jgi:hypothetical protein
METLSYTGLSYHNFITLTIHNLQYTRMDRHRHMPELWIITWPSGLNIGFMFFFYGIPRLQMRSPEETVRVVVITIT